MKNRWEQRNWSNKGNVNTCLWLEYHYEAYCCKFDKLDWDQSSPCKYMYVTTRNYWRDILWKTATSCWISVVYHLLMCVWGGVKYSSETLMEFDLLIVIMITCCYFRPPTRKRVETRPTLGMIMRKNYSTP